MKMLISRIAFFELVLGQKLFTINPDTPFDWYPGNITYYDYDYIVTEFDINPGSHGIATRTFKSKV